MQLTTFRPYFRYAGINIQEWAPEHFKVTSEIPYVLRELKYWEQWRRALSEKWFHILLEDQSFFLFSQGEGKASYSFYACPIVAPSLREYLQSLSLPMTQRNANLHLEEYQLLLDTAEIKAHVAPLRYDEDFASYRESVHPAAHLHIGSENSIRLATRRRLSPLAFVLLTIRQHYPENWVKLLELKSDLRLVRCIRDDLPPIDIKFWNEVDHLQNYLT